MHKDQQLRVFTKSVANILRYQCRACWSAQHLVLGACPLFWRLGSLVNVIRSPWTNNVTCQRGPPNL